MNVLELKGSIFDLIWGVEDAGMLVKIRELVNEVIDDARGNEDWWNELAPERQARLEKAIYDSDKGINLIPHEQVVAEINQRFKTTTNGK